MLGLGETRKEVIATLQDLRENGCKVVTIGQYLQPASHLQRVHHFVKPEEFEFYRKAGKEMGISYVESHPIVHSSYHVE